MGVICRESVTGVNVLEILVISGWETGGKNKLEISHQNQSLNLTSNCSVNTSVNRDTLCKQLRVLTFLE